ncbi:MAG TPA: TrkA family potassium uptake protein [Actinomycetota bacterium]|jgi:trk system potassium uptake protein TrkA|nr:TrkA family potassium uptake protein [Actinomycetota bacterium]
MHVVIVGCGRVGAALTVELGKGGHSVSIIDKRQDAFDRLPPGFQARTFVGTGFDRELLEEAGIAEAGAFVAVTNGDNSNIVSARVAREHYHVPKVIARIYDPRRAEIYERLNIPTVASAAWAAEQIQYLLFHGREELKETFAGGTLLHLQREIPDHLVGKPIWSVEEEGQIEVVGVDRGGRGFIPVKDSTFQNGDVAHFILLTDAVQKIDVLLEPLAE